MTQTYLPGTEPPHHNPDIEEALKEWFDARHQQKHAAADTKLRHSALLLQLAHAGVESYPYIDPANGKKRLVKVAREPKIKTANAPRWSGRDKDAEIGDEVEPGNNAGKKRGKKRGAKKAADAAPKVPLLEEAEQKRKETAAAAKQLETWGSSTGAKPAAKSSGARPKKGKR